VKLLQKEALNIIKNNHLGNLSLSYNHQPYIRFTNYSWDENLNQFGIIIKINKNDCLYKIINHNSLCAFLVNSCYCNYYNSVLITGKICILDTKDTGKNKVNLVIIPENIEGYSLNY
jgi:nitroimidazol reductase NimA-like FMN-containing flavoprotein (pyridoxamine 5'-phosphate oxidase superfamily)